MSDSCCLMNSHQSVDEYLTKLDDIYPEKKDFELEMPIFRELIPKLITALQPYVLRYPFALGSTATVWEVFDQRLNQRRALKLARPNLSKIEKIIRVIRAEGSRLAELSHENITKIYLSGEIPLKIADDDYSFPYFLMDYLDGVKDFDEYLLTNLEALPPETIISYFRDVALGLSYLHKNRIIHCDIKPGNILIAHDAPALIADLGYAKHFSRIPSESDKDFTDVTYTPEFAHPDLIDKMVKSTDSAANIAEIPRGDLRPAFDLFAFGRTLQFTLREIHKKAPLKFSPYQWRYLLLIAVRLLDGQVISSVNQDPFTYSTVKGLPSSIMPQICYSSSDDDEEEEEEELDRHAKEALEDIEKLLNLYDLEGEIPELNLNLNTYIQLPGGRFPLTFRVSRVINHPSLIRLSQVSQLGFVSLVYPGATHTRFEHTLGTFERCCEVVRSLWYDGVNCLFRSIMRKSDIEAVLLTSLLHDIGQYPMAHDLTEVDRLFSPDQFTEGLILKLDPDTGESLSDIIRSEWEAKPENVLAILRADQDSPLRERILNSIINGPLDADKQDYLYRDSLHAGVIFGKNIDVGRLLRHLTTCFETDQRDKLRIAELGVTEKARAVGESIWRARSEMFRQVYWHHTVRALKSMLAYVVRRILLSLDTNESRREFQRSLKLLCYYPLCSIQSPESLQATGSNHVEQANSPVEESFKNGDFIQFKTSCLSHSDDALLSFFWGYSDRIGRNILDMIRHRQFFKRIATVSFALEKEFFDSIYNRYRQYRLRGDLVQQEEWRKRLQREILKRCQEKGECDLNSIEATELPLILFDVPLKALRDPPGSEALCYVPEEQLGRSDEDPFGLISIAKLGVEIEKTTFDKEVGKIRVMVHPEWKMIVKQSFLRSEDIIDLLVKC